eukprot:4683953-Pyramimonas_sp.AAC.1
MNRERGRIDLRRRHVPVAAYDGRVRLAIASPTLMRISALFKDIPSPVCRYMLKMLIGGHPGTSTTACWARC